MRDNRLSISDLIDSLSLKYSNNLENILENLCNSKVGIAMDFIESYGVDFEMFLLEYGTISNIREDIRTMGYLYKIIEEEQLKFLLIWKEDNPRDCYSYCFNSEPEGLEE